MYFGIGPKSDDLLYKMVLIIGVTLLISTLVITHQKNKTLENKAGLLAISITDANLRHSQLLEQNELIRIELSSRETGDRAPHTSYEKQKLLQEQAELENAISSKQTLLDLLNQSKTETQNQGHLVYGIASATITVSLVMIVYGFLGWHFHLKIFRDRRKSPRSQ